MAHIPEIIAGSGSEQIRPVEVLAKIGEAVVAAAAWPVTAALQWYVHRSLMTSVPGHKLYPQAATIEPQPVSHGVRLDA